MIIVPVVSTFTEIFGFLCSGKSLLNFWQENRASSRMPNILCQYSEQSHTETTKFEIIYLQDHLTPVHQTWHISLWS